MAFFRELLNYFKKDSNFSDLNRLFQNMPEDTQGLINCLDYPLNFLANFWPISNFPVLAGKVNVNTSVSVYSTFCRNVIIFRKKRNKSFKLFHTPGLKSCKIQSSCYYATKHL